MPRVYTNDDYYVGKKWTEETDARRAWDEAHRGMKPASKPKPKEPTIDVVMADGNVVSTAKCNLCGKKPGKRDAVVRVRDLSGSVGPTTVIHRRCLEAMLEQGPEDEDRAQKRFDSYVEKVAEKQGLMH